MRHTLLYDRALGELLHHRLDPAAYRAASALYLLSPQTLQSSWGKNGRPAVLSYASPTLDEGNLVLRYPDWLVVVCLEGAGNVALSEEMVGRDWCAALDAPGSPHGYDIYDHLELNP